MEPDQATNELTEEQVLNFLVNTLDEEIDIGLGEDGEGRARKPTIPYERIEIDNQKTAHQHNAIDG